MTIDELTVGDIIRYRNDGKMFVVKEIHSDGVVLDRMDSVVPFSEIVAYSLDANFLKDNGFDEEEFDDEDIGLCVRYSTIINDWQEIIFRWRDSFDNGCGGHLSITIAECWAVDINAHGSYNNFVVRTCFKIHEFQHMLRVCGLGDFANNLKIK